MKKIAMLLSGVLLAGVMFSGCDTIPGNTTASSDDTFSSILSSEIDNVLQSGPEMNSMPVDFNPKDYGLIIPNIVEFNEDMWEKEKDSAVYSFITLDGEIVCGPLFDYVSYDNNAGAYIVRRTENGISKYGFLSSNGAVFTGLMFDGAASAQSNDDEEICFYGTIYDDGKLYVYPVDIDLEVLESTPVTIKEQELNLTAKNSQLSVLYMNQDNAVLINRSEFYYTTFLVDSKSGDMLQKYDIRGSQPPVKIFGNVITLQDIHGQGLTVYSMEGSVLFEDPKAYSGKVTNDHYMTANDGVLNIFDGDWKKINTMNIPEDSTVMTSFGRIAVVGINDTKVYDKDLNLINSLDYQLSGGTYFRNWYDFGEGDMFYDSISGTEEIINLNTGAKLEKEDDFFYEFKLGYILADNESNGNDPIKKFRVYSKDFKEILSGEGSADIVSDVFTGDLYLVILDEGVFTVYSLPSMNKLFSLKASCYSLNPAGGRFYGNDREHFVLVDGNGNELLSYEIDYTKVNGI